MNDRNDINDQLKQRLLFEKANNLTPLSLRNWIAKNQYQEGWELELWSEFIFPLQLEVENLRYRPKQAIPVEPPSADDLPF